MKVVGILGSPRSRGNTSILLDAVLEGAAQAGAETERFAMAGLTMNYCVACHQCHREGICRWDDDVETLKQAMLTAQGIVLGSPVYLHSVTAQLKTLMDRCGDFVHCRRLGGKYAAAVSTAGGSEQEAVMAFQNRFLRTCGAWTVGGVAALAAPPRGVQNQEARVAEATALGRELVAAIAERRPFPDQEAEHAEMFNRMKGLVSAWGEAFPAQYDYWRERGWL